jgi:NTE family protein
MWHRPDILVLGAGGVLGEAWMTGVLAGLEETTGTDLRRCEYFVGTSAGSIVAARLAAGSSPRPPDDPTATLALATRPEPTEPGPATSLAVTAQRAGAWALALSSPLAPLSLSLSARGGALARAAILRAGPHPHGSLGSLRAEVDATGVRFDGRLRVTTVARATGRRVVFGRPGSPPATVGQAVEASCTVPWIFAPVTIAGVDYVDGGVWSPTNLDAAPAGRGSHVLCLNPTAGLTGPHPIVGILRRGSRVAMNLEAGALRARGADVRLIGPDPDSAAAIGTNLMARARAAAVLAAGYAQGRALGSAARSQGAPTSSVAGVGRSRLRRALESART